MTAAQTPSRAHWLPFIVAATFFMEYLDTTIIATALPQMAQAFKVGPNELSLGMTAYMLTLAVFIPISGWIADRLGSRTVFATAIVIFTLASVLCGISGNVFEFTAARILQGMGGALMVPVGRLIVVRNTSKDKLMQAIHIRFGLPAQLSAEIEAQIKLADMGAAYLEATNLAGFSQAESRRLFGRDPGLPHAVESGYMTPWPASKAEKQFLARFKTLIV